MRGRSLDGEWQVALAGLVLAGAGWWFHAVLLALAGMLAALGAVGLWVWQRECLTGVSYRRTLGQQRAMFGEEVALEIELVNDKLLPLTWLHVEDDVSGKLTIRGGTVLTGRSDYNQVLHHLLPMLPYQRVRRHLTIVCDHRGLHTFGTARLRSGDPVGYRQRSATVRERDRLLVYPKIFRLEPSGVASRVPLGEERSALTLLGDPSRVAGVRGYQSGDPLRHIDWRATARSTALLVRVFEPTAALRVAVFVDLRLPQLRWRSADAPEVEFTVALAASLVADFAARGLAVGLFSAGTVDGHLLAHAPSRSPGALPEMLELLARVSPFGPGTVADVLTTEGGRFHGGTSVVVVAADFPEPTLVAIAELRRRLPVTAIWVATDHGAPPPPEFVDARRDVAYTDDWKQRTTVDLVA